MGRSLRFGSRARDSTALFGLAFATASPHGLTSPRSTNSQAHSSKGTPSPHKRGLRRIVDTWFQELFHSPPGVLFTIPSRYSYTIGHTEYLGLPGGPGRFTADSTSPLLLGHHNTHHTSSSPTGLSPSTAGHSNPLHLTTYSALCSGRNRKSWPHNTACTTPTKYHIHTV